MAAAIRKTPAWLTEAGERMGLPPVSQSELIAWLAAAEILRDWPERFNAFVNVFQQVDKHRTTSTGVGRRFGMLLRHAAKLQEFGWSTPAETLRNYLVEHYTAGHVGGKVCLFQSPKDRAALRQRAWVTQTMATKMLGLRHGAVAQLVQDEFSPGSYTRQGGTAVRSAWYGEILSRSSKRNSVMHLTCGRWPDGWVSTATACWISCTISSFRERCARPKVGGFLSPPLPSWKTSVSNFPSVNLHHEAGYPCARPHASSAQVG